MGRKERVDEEMNGESEDGKKGFRGARAYREGSYSQRVEADFVKALPSRL